MIKGIDGATFTVAGTPIGKVQSIAMDMESIGKDMGFVGTPIFSGTHIEGVGTIGSGLTFDSTALYEQLPKFDIEVIDYRWAPPKPIRSKKKRLRKKWQKLYDESVDRRIHYENCVIQETGGFSR